jgi:UDP:flavonoid glycosyltransferase YjiC (YdhE family)
MARFLLCTFPSDGHVNPALPVARTLVARGHEVMWYAGRRYQGAIEATGARFSPRVAAWEPEDGRPAGHAPGATPERGLKALKSALVRVFISDVPGQVADLRRILHTFPADVVLADPLVLGVGVLHELGGPRWATLGLLPLMLSSRDTAPFGTGLPPSWSPSAQLRNWLLNAISDRVLFRDMQQHMEAVRKVLGLPPAEASVLNSTLSPYLYLQGATPAFEYPRGDLPPQVHFIGPLLPPTTPDFTPPAWWGDLRGDRPVVLVNQGTVSKNPKDLLVPALRALEEEDVLVVATTGGAPAADIAQMYARATDAAQAAAEIRSAINAGILGGFGYVYSLPMQQRTPEEARPRPAKLPGNARVEPFIPFGALLPHVDAMITNGGYGGVQLALAHGVPLIVAGDSEEKPEIAARVAWSGAGINLKTKTPSPTQIRSALRAVLDNGRYRLDARRIAADYARHSPADEAAALLERLATTRQPVLREEALNETAHPSQIYKAAPLQSSYPRRSRWRSS